MLEQNDATLVRQCLEGNLKAFERLVDKYQKTIFNVALRMVNDYAEAEDIAQVVFVRAYEKLASFDPSYKFFSWLYRLAVNESLNALKRKRRFAELDDSFVSGDKTPEEDYEQNEMAQRIETALMQLEPEHRALIVLKHFHGLGYQEIGYIFDLPEKTVKSRLFTARQLLKNILLKQGFVAND
ncbi:MAG: sigma-70 family RNA polymerase sigma factor [candidate division KSB1 bacterium]|nr:sigma-70 family RNA polymerase sigma factor [candidate division KSB1 bacterium]MDZ7303652.1 sigma-70 family RNA polymerase sigma factor [candidate division KSB1 bacterium]MDZ7313328.1 sigma-70 family RNA polymerase sigma factor [candidate division KSB1 bacterium]